MVKTGQVVSPKADFFHDSINNEAVESFFPPGLQKREWIPVNKMPQVYFVLFWLRRLLSPQKWPCNACVFVCNVLAKPS